MAIAPETGAAMQFGGNMFSAYANYQQNQQNLEFQEDLAKKGMQWKTADLRKAGLNPILAATSGTGPSVGGGSSIPVNFDSSAYLQYQQAKKIKEEAKILKEKAKKEPVKHL